METKFNSQICTSRFQSERLLSLGLKKETSDMKYVGLCRNEDGSILFQKTPICKGVITENNIDIPAWSLHRLWELANIEYIILDSEDEIAVLYDEVIMKIEQCIEEGYFNKEYLV
jgi:hypothetical protein